MPELAWERVEDSDDFQTTDGVYRVFAQGFRGLYQASVRIPEGGWKHITRVVFELEDAKKVCERNDYYIKEDIKDA